MKKIVTFSVLSLVLSSPAMAKAKPVTHAKFFTGIAIEAQEGDFEGQVKISGCSASLVKFKGQSAKSKAMVLTNDHCLDDQAPGKFTVNKPYPASLRIFKKDKTLINKVFEATKIIYASQTDTDFGLLQLSSTFEEIEKNYDVIPLEISDRGAEVGDEVLVITSYFEQVIACGVTGIVKLKESDWTWRNSYRYDNCKTGHGTSGSPMILKYTREVVGINNTGNDDGLKCSLNNPCEIDANGNITAIKGQNYGQPIVDLNTCLDSNFEFNIKTPGCKLLGGDSFPK